MLASLGTVARSECHADDPEALTRWLITWHLWHAWSPSGRGPAATMVVEACMLPLMGQVLAVVGGARDGHDEAGGDQGCVRGCLDVMR